MAVAGDGRRFVSLATLGSAVKKPQNGWLRRD